MVLIGAALYGAGRSHGLLTYVHPLVGLAGLLLVSFSYPLRQSVPSPAFAAFYVGLAILTLMALFVSGMALVDDWV